MTIRCIKAIARLTALLISLVLLGTGCEKIRDIPYNDIISVSAQVESHSRSGYTTARLDEFRFFVVNASSAEYTYMNILMRRVAGEFISYDDELNRIQMRWQSPDAPVRVMATTYDNAMADDGIVVLSVDADQRNTEAFDRSDILYFSADRIVPATDLVNGKLPISFSHICARFRLEITFASAGISEGNPITQITINGLKTEGGFNFTTGHWAEPSGDPTVVAPFEEGYSPASRTAVYDAIVVPQTTTAQSLIIRFTVGSKVYDYLVLPQIDFTRNTTHKLAIHVSD